MKLSEAIDELQVEIDRITVDRNTIKTQRDEAIGFIERIYILNPAVV